MGKVLVASVCFFMRSVATFLLLAVWTGVEWRGKGLSTGLCGGFGSLALGLLDLASDSCIKVKVVAVSLVDRSPGDVRGRILLDVVAF